ncbi:MAG TPA: PmeII family type II restriction endonuclease [Ktedonobacteraceae bacterium]|nr:PmeII family type II restriction endonuclease [Ktedonobacteraceae bacterium]
MNPSELEDLIRRSLDDFYQRRMKKLTELKLSDVLRKKNPYLLRAIGVRKASEIVTEILRAYMSSSDESIFGDAFFEPIARLCSGGTVSPSEGVDVAVESDAVYKAFSIKSGPNIFNASQAKRQHDEFNSLRHRMHKIHKQFDPILGHCYGKRSSNRKGKLAYRVLSGQALWEELTGDPNFYIKLIHLMHDYPTEHRREFEKAWDNALNRFEGEFIINFGNLDGSINWEKLLRFNSGKEKVAWVSVSKVLTTVSAEVHGDVDDTKDAEMDEVQ